MAVKGASVSIEGKKVVVTKPIDVRIPFVDEVNLKMRRESEFFQEIDSFYYGKPPHLQGSPIDGFSGYTGNPYKKNN